ncbi:hypothetical protein TNCV_1099901 [Trichonephila clavipes]|nr:hypothetical protein TNCV_1099901 [Trichonephila clavipes]
MIRQHHNNVGDPAQEEGQKDDNGDAKGPGMGSFNLGSIPSSETGVLPWIVMFAKTLPNFIATYAVGFMQSVPKGRNMARKLKKNSGCLFFASTDLIVKMDFFLH